MAPAPRAVVGLGLVVAQGCVYPSARIREDTTATANLAGGPGLGNSLPGAGATSVERTGAGTNAATEPPIAVMASIGAGGTTAGGGATSTSGSAQGGAIAAIGGAVTTASSMATGGVMPTASGGRSNLGTVVTFYRGKANGAMTGYGYPTLGAVDIITDPTCGSDKTEITKATNCSSFTNWSNPNALCISGTIPGLPTNPTSSDYEVNWGEGIGLCATDLDCGTLGQTFTSIAFSLTGIPSAVTRTKVHRKGDPADVEYCVENIDSDVAIPFAAYSTACWNLGSPGVFLTAADVPNIDRVTIQVLASKSSAITVTNFCLNGITFK